jgi:hypothetical protein
MNRFPTSLGAAYVFEAGRDVAACLELENTRPNAHPSTTADLTARCSSSKLAALDRALLKTCSFDSVLQVIYICWLLRFNAYRFMV